MKRLGGVGARAERKRSQVRRLFGGLWRGSPLITAGKTVEDLAREMDKRWKFRSAELWPPLTSAECVIKHARCSHSALDVEMHRLYGRGQAILGKTSRFRISRTDISLQSATNTLTPTLD